MVVSVPLNLYEHLSPESLAAKIVVDTMNNYYPQRDSRIDVLDRGELTSTEFVQRTLASSRVVKALNNLDSHRLGANARPEGHPERSALPIAGGDQRAKAAVAQLKSNNGVGFWRRPAATVTAADVGRLAEDAARREAGGVFIPSYVGPS